MYPNIEIEPIIEVPTPAQARPKKLLSRPAFGALGALYSF